MNAQKNDYAAAYGMPVTPRAWSEFRDEVLALYRPPMRAKPTYTGMVHTFKILSAIGIESTADLTVSFIGRVVETRPPTLSPNSVRGTLRYVQALCSYAEKMAYLRPSPFRIRGIGDWVRPVPPAGKQYASQEDIRKVLEHMAAGFAAGGWEGWKARRVHAFTATLALSGMRYSEAMWMHAADVDLARGTLAIVSRASHRLKTAGAHALVPLHPDLDSLLRSSWLEHRMSVPPGFLLHDPNCPFLFPTLRRDGNAPWTSGGPGQRPNVRMKVLAAEVGVLLTPLMLRHSFATHLAATGAGPIVVQQWLRHTNATTQKYYVHQSLEHMRSAGALVRY